MSRYGIAFLTRLVSGGRNSVPPVPLAILVIQARQHAKTLAKSDFAKSSYRYRKRHLIREDLTLNFESEATRFFVRSADTNGYRQILAALNREGFVISEKVDRRIMKEYNLAIPCAKRKKYSPQAGEASPAIDNVLYEDFRAESPKEKRLTDIIFALLIQENVLPPCELGRNRQS